MNKAIFISSVVALSSFNANSGISIIDNENGNFSIGGDVEFDLNYRDLHESDSTNFDQDGRIRLNFDGERFTDNGKIFKVRVQPKMGTDGSISTDDAWFSFGQKESWALRVGRFEAFDMFPVGQDTFLEYSGNTSNSLYQDGEVYAYQMKEGRGRGTSGQLMYTQKFDNLYVELGTLIGDRSVLFGDSTIDGTMSYHGLEVTNNKDSALLRPVVQYQLGDLSLAASMEMNLVKDAVIITSGGEKIDISDRLGYGVTGKYNLNNIELIANVAYMDAVDEKNLTLGANALIHGFGIGYIFAENKFENKKISGWAEGKATSDTVYASYEFSDVMTLEDFSIYLGAYYTKVNDKTTNSVISFNEDKDKGLRLRFKYYF
ncbi:carbohydrate porin [Vibrio kyushuensis]|uniref:carbohydrate porin n=1 Tax=Vibrio kyushuensis TaxID=2910249 RepID=UPI003D1336BF